MPKAAQTKPFDVVVALRLLRSGATMQRLAEELAVAPSQVHAAIQRLRLAGLLRPDERATNGRALLDFLLFGVRHAFPAWRGALTTGIPTAYSAEPLNGLVDAVDVVVWPATRASGAVQGFSVAPLYARAPLLRETDVETYRALTIVDALRLGDARIRAHARPLLEALMQRDGAR